MGGVIHRKDLDRTMWWLSNVLGVGALGDAFFCYKDSTVASYLRFKTMGVDSDHLKSTLATAYAATTNDRNDIVILSPESHQLASSLTWSNYCTHLVGFAGKRPTQFQRARFGASADFTPVTTLSGWGCTWDNVRVAHGRGNAANLVGVNFSGHYNNWSRVHLYSPGSTTEGDVGATMMSMSLAGGNNYFEGCTLGLDTLQRSAANSLININTSATNNVFKNCIFHMYQDASTPYFIWCASGSGVQNRWTFFDDCVFIAYSANWGTDLTVAVGYNYSGNGHRLIFKDCGFAGVTDIIADGYENNIQMINCNTYVSANTVTGLTVVPVT
jgi:hypothetical protein